MQQKLANTKETSYRSFVIKATKADALMNPQIVYIVNLHINDAGVQQQLKIG